MKQIFELSKNRKCCFVEKEKLAIVDFSLINNDKLLEMGEYLSLSGGAIYIEKNDELLGIMTSGDVSRSLAAKEKIYVNNKYHFISDINQIGVSFFESFFDTHTNIQELPIVTNGKLIGEFRLSYNNESSNHMRWAAIKNTAYKWLDEHGFKSIWISSADECKQLMEVINMQVVSIPEDADICIVDNENMRERLSKNHKKYGVEKNINLLYNEILTRHVIKKSLENNIPFFVFESPVYSKLKNMSEEELSVFENAPSIESIVADETIMNRIYGDCDSRKYMQTEISNVQFFDNGLYFQMADTVGKYFCVRGGQRRTLEQPEKYKGTIWCFGVCTTRGAYVSDDATIETYLQQIINNNKIQYRVVNCGVAGLLGMLNDFRYILYSEFKPNDIIVCIGNYGKDAFSLIQELGGQTYELSSLFHRPHDYGRWFVDNPLHINPTGNRVIAKYIYQIIEKSLKNRHFKVYEGSAICFSEITPEKDEYICKEDLQVYIERVKEACEEQKISLANIVGAIVMNCNPFTLGHRYLIEKASSEVDTLIIFIVEPPV